MSRARTRDAASKQGGSFRVPVPTIRDQLRKLVEPRQPLAATRVVTAATQYVVLTLAPRPAARLFGKGRPANWETKVYIAHPPSFGIGVQPDYVVLDTNRDAALARHETLLRRLESGSFDRETSREILQTLRPFVDRAARAFGEGATHAALAALDEALTGAERLDRVHRFLHLYAEVFLMQALAIEETDRVAALAAYRAVIALHAEHPLHHPDTLRAVAQAREAAERLTPAPRIRGQVA